MPKSSANRWNKKRVFRLIAWLAAGVIITVAGVIGWRHSTLRDIRGSQQSGATARQIQVEVVGLDTKPISGARVEIIAGKSSSIRTTDAGGKARFSVAASEKAKMIVQASGYARKILAIDLSQNTNVLRIRVAPGAELAGQVRDDLGAPVPKATLTFRVQQTAASEPWTIESDDQGRFSVTTLDPGSYLVEAQARNHERAVRPDAIAPSDEPLTMELRRTAKLLGTVTSPDGNPAAGAQVTFAGSGCWPPRKTMSNSEGKFEATELVAGIYEIRASNKNSASEPVSDLQLEPGDVRSVHLLLAEGHVLQVEVVDAQSEKPIANADITVAEEALSFYASLFRNGKVGNIPRYEKGEEPDKEGAVKHGYAVLDGYEIAAMDSAQSYEFTFNEAVSLVVHCKDSFTIQNRFRHTLLLIGVREAKPRSP